MLHALAVGSWQKALGWRLFFIKQPGQSRPESVPRIEGGKYIVDTTLNQRKRGRGYQFLMLSQGSLEYDAEWQPTRDFVDTDGTMNDQFISYIKPKNIMKEK